MEGINMEDISCRRANRMWIKDDIEDEKNNSLRILHLLIFLWYIYTVTHLWSIVTQVLAYIFLRSSLSLSLSLSLVLCVCLSPYPPLFLSFFLSLTLCIY